MENNLFTQKEACELLGSYPRQFSQVVDSHSVPFQVVGGRRVFTKEAIEMARPHIESLKNQPKGSRQSRAAIA